jgi:hypothetical protein
MDKPDEPISTWVSVEVVFGRNMPEEMYVNAQSTLVQDELLDLQT